ncbi:MAG: redoxin domain-containing protein, partial [Armatimonadetes bacterium]|nr:redoxin domain-containing protein [Armatimonadota bacterium]
VGSAPCRTTMSELEKLQQQYRGDRVGIFLINLDGVKARAAVNQFGLTYPILTDEGYVPLPPTYQVKRVPHLLVVDQDGLIRFSRAGSDANLLTALKASVEQYRPPRLPRLLDLEGLGCAACRPMPPLLRSVQEELAGKVRIDIRDFDPDLVAEYGLERLPTQIFYDADGREVYRHGGLMTRDEVLNQFRKMGVATE